jgi:predicted nucleic acid-binding protein
MTLDTNILIAYLKGEYSAIYHLTKWQREGRVFFLPTIVEMELLSFPAWTEKERFFTERFLEENFTSLPLERSIARLAARCRSKTKIKSPDAIIAASALFTKTPLVTRNEKDFRPIKGLVLITL